MFGNWDGISVARYEVSMSVCRKAKRWAGAVKLNTLEFPIRGSIATVPCALFFPMFVLVSRWNTAAVC